MKYTKNSERHDQFIDWLDKVTARCAYFLVAFIFIFLLYQVLRTYNFFTWLE